MAEKKERSSGHFSASGCIVEWRLRPESVVLADMLSYEDAGPEWHQARYVIETLGRATGTEADRLVRPYISNMTCDLAQYELVSELVAEAIIACLKTTLKPCLLNHIEWRIVHVRLEASHKIIVEQRDG